MMKPEDLYGKMRKYQCKYCKRKYLHCGTWLFKHFKKHHPGKQVAVKEVYVSLV